MPGTDYPRARHYGDGSAGSAAAVAELQRQEDEERAAGRQRPHADQVLHQHDVSLQRHPVQPGDVVPGAGAGHIEPEQHHPAVGQQLGGGDVERRPGRGFAVDHVLRERQAFRKRLEVAIAPTGAQQHTVTGLQPPVLGLPRFHPVDAHPRADAGYVPDQVGGVDHRRRHHQLLERHVLGRVQPPLAVILEEVRRRIPVGTHMLVHVQQPVEVRRLLVEPVEGVEMHLRVPRPQGGQVV